MSEISIFFGWGGNDQSPGFGSRNEGSLCRHKGFLYAGHIRKVARLAFAIAEEMDLPKVKIEGTYVAGTLHDIGKIYVPVEILKKPGRLTEMEMSMVKAHSRVGPEILKEIEFPWPVAQIVGQHHERMDGSGYPQGLFGEEIILEARILAVADVVEAHVISHKPYSFQKH